MSWGWNSPRFTIVVLSPNRVLYRKSAGQGLKHYRFKPAKPQPRFFLWLRFTGGVPAQDRPSSLTIFQDNQICGGIAAVCWVNVTLLSTCGRH